MLLIVNLTYRQKSSPNVVPSISKVEYPFYFQEYKQVNFTLHTTIFQYTKTDREKTGKTNSLQSFMILEITHLFILLKNWTFKNQEKWALDFQESLYSGQIECPFIQKL